MKRLDSQTQEKVLAIIKADGGWHWSSIQGQTKIGAGNGSKLFWLLVATGIIDGKANAEGIYPILHRGER